MERAESFVIEIDNSNVDTLLRQFNGNLALLSQYLKIMNNRMVLLNPNFSQKDQAEGGQQQPDGEGKDCSGKGEVEPVQEEALNDDAANGDEADAANAEQPKENGSPEAINEDTP